MPEDEPAPQKAPASKSSTEIELEVELRQSVGRQLYAVLTGTTAQPGPESERDE